MDGWFNTIIGQHQISHKDIAAKLSWSGYGWLLLRMNVHIMWWICMDLNYLMRLYQIPMHAGAKLLALEIDIDDNDNVKVRRCVKDESACVFEVLIAEWRGNIRIENLTAKFLLFRSWLSMGSCESHLCSTNGLPADLGHLRLNWIWALSCHWGMRHGIPFLWWMCLLKSIFLLELQI